MKKNIPTPDINQVTAGSAAFQKHEKRDAMYLVATYLVEEFWNEPSKLANGLGVLLFTWNHAHYRYGPFEYESLQECLAKHVIELTIYRQRHILEYTADDDAGISKIFEEFSEALVIVEGAGIGRRSPVAVAKALHLLAPNFFPLWDEKIAIAYGCRYAGNPVGAYLKFFGITHDILRELQDALEPIRGDRTLLKILDEYNYAKHTKKWIKNAEQEIPPT